MGNFPEQQAIYYFICGNDKIDNKIIDEIFKVKGTQRVYEKKEPKVKWFAKIYPVGLNANICQNICNDIQNNGEKKIIKNVLLCFGSSQTNILCDKIDEMDEVYRPLIIFLTNKKITSEMIDVRKIRNIILCNDHAKNLIAILSELWKIEGYYNERGNQYFKFLPDNCRREKGISSDNTLNILITGFSRSGKSTFINLIAQKLIAFESPVVESNTKSITSYYISLDDSIQNIAKLNLIDSPGLIIEQKDGKLTNNYISKVKKVIEDLIFNYKKKEEKINFILFFIRGSHINTSGGINDFMKYLDKLDIKIIFVINGAVVKKREKHSPIYGSLKKFFTENKFNRLIDQDIFDVNLVETQNCGIYGVSKIFKTIKEYFLNENPCLSDNSIDKIDKLINKYEEIKNNGNKIEKDFKKEVQDCLKELNKSKILENFENCKDMIRKAYIESTLYSTGLSSSAFLSSWIPVPFIDIPIVLSIQAFTIIKIGQVYGFNYNQINFLDCLKACFGSSVGESAQIVSEGGVIIGKEMIEKGASISVNQLMKYLPNLAAKLTTSEISKSIPIIGTIIGGLISSVVNTTTTATLCYKCQKYYEKQVEETQGLYFLKNRIESFKNLCNKLDDINDSSNESIEYIECN